MSRTRVFKSGNSQAVRIPAEFAYADGTELEIMRTGDITTLIPAKRQNLKAMIEELRRLPKPGEIEKREPIEMPDRE
ncbi:MAG TPA: AbrB/MazE/SpoVT family DNA-binding domain-containing protein [Rhizomicrobium sp.]